MADNFITQKPSLTTSIINPVTCLLEPTGTAFDAFSRLRVSEAEYRFDSQFTYQIDSDLWDSFNNNGNIIFDSTNRAGILTPNTNTPSAVSILQSHYHAPYTPGRGQLAFITFKFGTTPPVNTERAIGLSDGENGVELVQDNTGLKIILRSTSSQGNQIVPQSDWNIDPMNGTGPSELLLNPEKVQIFFVQYQALYVGSVVVGFDIGGKIIPVHKFDHANNVIHPYIAQANLPIRYRCSMNNSPTQITTTAICGTVISEGGESLQEIQGRVFTASNGNTSIAVTTRRPILSIRPKQLFNGIKNHTLLIQLSVEVLARTNDAFLEIIRDGTLSGPTSFANVDTAYSTVEFDRTSTGITGGTPVTSFFAPASASTRSTSDRSLLGKVILSYSHLLSQADILTVVATSRTGTSDIHASLTWKEIR